MGVFALQLFRNFQRNLFLFLIPFEAIGLALFVSWVVTLTAPFRAEKRIVGRDGLAARVSVLGLGRTKRVGADEVGRIELRNDPRGRLASNNVSQGQDNDTPYWLRFVGRDGLDLLVIASLTEGEARWIGGATCDTLQDSLPMDVTPPVPAALWDPELDG
ncbi:MAG: hypothetical protein LC745_10725 [Planctomycetia bacterium]|nr:hypothetical protein [Planctomycetia bacterium]